MTALASPPVVSTPGPPERRAERRPFVSVGVLVVVVIKSAVSLAFAGAYGWHRDELYYLSSGRHPDWGYVDFPPITPLLAGGARLLFGADSLIGLRSIAVLAGAGVIVVTARIARDLGGGPRAEMLAALLAAAPLTLGANAMFQTVSFDQLGWALVLWAAVRLLRDGGDRRWIELGVAVAMAWMTKYTSGLLLVALGAGFVLTPLGRSRLRGRGPWIAAALVLVVSVPNLWWQVRHGWPTVDFFLGRNYLVREENPPADYVLELLALSGFLALPIWLAGVVRLWRSQTWRALAVTVMVVVPGWLLLGGKSYYAAPVLLAPLAAGAVAIEQRWRNDRAWAAIVTALVLFTVLSAPLILPVLPVDRMVDAGIDEVRDDYVEQLGWPELVDQIAAVWYDLPADQQTEAAILAGNYGEAGAIDLIGPDLGLPPAVSGHLGHRYWTPPEDTLAATTLVVVGYPHGWLTERCTSFEPVGTIDNRSGVDNEEAGGSINVCELPGTLADLWPTLAHD